MTDRHWESLSDAQLLDCKLTVDDPEALVGLVREIPEGPEETYVEYHYDFRRSDHAVLICVHCHHEHLCGYVIRKSDARCLVGWECAFKIYGESFNQLKADYQIAVNRQTTVRRRQELKDKIAPFTVYLDEAVNGNAVSAFEGLRERLAEHLPWIWENAPRAQNLGWLPRGIEMPRSFLEPSTDPRAALQKISLEVKALQHRLATEEHLEEEHSFKTKRTLAGLIARTEKAMQQLKEAEAFFQPAVTTALCDRANELDNPSKRKYVAGLTAIVCKREKSECVVALPQSFKIPDVAALAKIKEALTKQ